jgi:hypothetical protein
MKLSKLNEEIRTFAGMPISVQFLGDQNLTYKSALVAVCELYKPEPGSGKAIQAFRIGSRIQEAGDDVEIEREEALFLRSMVDQSSLFMAGITGRLMDYIDKETGLKFVTPKE